MKALYVHGYGSDKNTTSGTYANQILNKYNCTVITDTFDLTNPIKALEQIAHYFDYIDLLMGSSLGAFYVLQSQTNLPKIVINPCMYPSVEIPKLNKEPNELLTKWAMMENYRYNNIDDIEKKNVFGIFAKSDELFVYRNKFIDLFGNQEKENTTMIEGHHKLQLQEMQIGLSKAITYYNTLFL